MSRMVKSQTRVQYWFRIPRANRYVVVESGPTTRDLFGDANRVSVMEGEKDGFVERDPIVTRGDPWAIAEEKWTKEGGE